MTDFMRYDAYEGQNLGESQVMGYSLMSESACDGFSMSGPMDIPSSPCSVSSEWSNSTNTTECMSHPTSPSPCEDDVSPKRPMKSSLKRAGTASRKVRVTWDPSVIFETRPLSGKRRRNEVQDGDDDVEKEIMAGNYDADMKAPIPTKRAKLAEMEIVASVTPLYFTPAATPPLFPEASRTVIPSFNFNSTLSRSLQTCSNLQESAHEPSTRPSFVSFTLVNPKRTPLAQSKILTH